jgi:hypothetical protein
MQDFDSQRIPGRAGSAHDGDVNGADICVAPRYRAAVIPDVDTPRNSANSVSVE